MTRTVSVTLTNDATPVTDATVTLSDAAATYGIRQATTNTLVVAAGTAVPHTTGGTYAYAFTGAVAGTAYEAVLKIVWADGSIDYVARDLAALAAGSDTAGTYWTRAGVASILGDKNLITQANLQNDTRSVEDANTTARIVQDGTDADAYTNFRARRGNRGQYPNAGTVAIPTSDPDFDLIRRATNLYASALLVEHRIWVNSDGSTANQAVVDLNGRAMDLYDQIFGELQNYNPDEDKPGTIGNVPLTHGECCERFYL